MICLMSVNEFKTETSSEKLDRLIAQAAAGDTEALGLLYDATNVSVYGFVLSILKNTQDAEDVLQDCYVSIYSSGAGYRSEGKPMAWIMGIARNLSLYKLRERKKTADLPQEDWESGLVFGSGLNAEDRLVLTECMNRLSDEERQIVMLHAVSGFKHREIAAILELSLPAVLSKYNRALKKLRKYL